MENGPQPAWYQIAEVELIYKSKVKASLRPQIATSRDAYNVFLQIWDKNKIELLEQFKVLFLNTASRVLGVYELSTGGISGTIADPRLVYSAALKANAVSIVLCHSHPSGSLKPSRQDEELTEKLKHAGRFLDIKVLDHIIITAESYFSFADEGIL
jgi:DNA repair protein RadC